MTDADSADADRVDADRVDADRVDADSADANRTDANRADPDRADADRADPDRADADRADTHPGNVADLVAAGAATQPDRPALLGNDVRVTWGELDAAVDAGAAALIGLGLPPGARVVVALPQGPDVIVAQLAVLRAGLVAVPVDPARTDLAVIAGRVQADVTIALGGDHGRPFALTPADVSVWWAAADRHGGSAAVGPRAGGEDLAMVARATYSDRAVMLSHRAMLAAVRAIDGLAGLGLRASDRVLLALPLHHPSGFVTAFLPLAIVGAAGVLPTGSEPAAALAAVRSHRVSIVPATPALFHDFAREPEAERALASVRLMTSGAAPLEPTDFAAIRHLTGQPVWEGYGISESGSVVSTSLMAKVAHPGSVGLPVPGLSVRIVGDSDASAEDLDDDGIVATVGGTGDVGRIEISGATLFSGYWPDGAGGPDADGWFVTGDYGYTDDAGNLHLIDRAAETISVTGFRVFPREIETVLAEHPYVAEVAVVGVPAPVGDRMVAVLVARPGTRPTRDDLEEFVAARLPQFKHPTDYAVVDALPRKELGRIDRAATRALYAGSAGIDLSAGGSTGLAAVAEPVASTEAVADVVDELPDGEVAEPEEPALDVTPESAADLDELGRRLPGREPAAERGAEDTDEDLFGDEVD